MNEELIINNNLTRLSKYLNYNLSASVLFLFSFFAFGLIFLVSIAAIVFTPFMLYVLFQEKKKGWISFFVILVLIPFILSIILNFTVDYAFPWFLIVLALFYLYCFLLRMEVNNWVRERRVKMEYILQKRRRDEENEIFLKQFKN